MQSVYFRCKHHPAQNLKTTVVYLRLQAGNEVGLGSQKFHNRPDAKFIIRSIGRPPYPGRKKTQTPLKEKLKKIKNELHLGKSSGNYGKSPQISCIQATQYFKDR
jgi:hypothetical protein